MALLTAADRQRLDDMVHAEWPVHAIACRACNGSGGDFWQEERCNACLGRGFRLPACKQCNDTGEVPEIDPEGQYAGAYPCDCEVGTRLMASTPATPFVAGNRF